MRRIFETCPEHDYCVREIGGDEVTHHRDAPKGQKRPSDGPLSRLAQTIRAARTASASARTAAEAAARAEELLKSAREVAEQAAESKVEDVQPVSIAMSRKRVWPLAIPGVVAVVWQITEALR